MVGAQSVSLVKQLAQVLFPAACKGIAEVVYHGCAIGLCFIESLSECSLTHDRVLALSCGQVPKGVFTLKHPYGDSSPQSLEMGLPEGVQRVNDPLSLRVVFADVFRKCKTRTQPTFGDSSCFDHQDMQRLETTPEIWC